MSRRDSDSFIKVLRYYGEPVTRENYLATAWAGNPPEPLGPELESMLPRELRLWHDDEDGEEQHQ